MECLFSDQFHLKDEFGRLNYVKLDSILDLMIEHRIRPFLILDSQMSNVLKSMDDTKTINVIKVFDNLEECIDIIGQVMDYLLYRYGQHEISQWKFAVWYDTFNENILGLKNDFVEVWDAIYELIIQRIPNAQIGGCGLGPTVGRKKLKEFYMKWREAIYLPAFLTLHCLPYGEAEQGNNSKPVVRRNVEDFFEEDITVFKGILKEIDFPELPIIVSEWNLSFLQRNYFNDMAGKAAIMLHHVIFAINEVAEICYWPASDIYAEDFDADSVLNGAAGLISADGICKPTFYALAFMQELYGSLVARGNHYIVTKDDHGHYCMILYNNKKLNYTYYNQEEAQIKPTDGTSIFSDRDALELTITLKGVENRKYMLRKQLVGEEVGSILDEWLKFGTDMPIRMNDIQYLKSRCIPLRINEELSVQDGILVLQEKLRAYEIMLIQLI